MKYTYRGITILTYHPDRREVVAEHSEMNGVHLNYVKLIPEDCQLLALFFMKVGAHMTGQLDEALLTDVEVN